MAKGHNEKGEYKQPKSAPAAPSIAKSGAKVLDEMNISTGGISKTEGNKTKTDGIKIRGTGAATKGTKSRGPMA